MATETTLAPGTFCWVELATTDAASARKFYTELFGWKAQDVPVGDMGTYTMLQLGGKDAAALYPMDAQRMGQGIPSHWMSYVLVENVDKSAEKAGQLGATVLQPPFDVMDVGRMAVLRDPTGAVFALWQKKKHPGAGVFQVPGSLCWNELMTEDEDRARKFYTGLFNWNADAMPVGPILYTVFKNDDKPAGGMMTLPQEARNMGAPPHWLPYFAVDDCDRIVNRVSELGGAVLMPPTDFENVGRGAVVADPTRGVFGVIRLMGQ
ncbi:MAG: VOC family protein [Armatimonadetes bacterium]|nr:VOC family protein [Armatimonadota bacterium]